MATIFPGFGDLADARAGKSAYIWALAIDSRQRAAMLRDGWKGVGEVFVQAIPLYAVYQYLVQRLVCPGEKLIVEVFLAILPYLVFRGPVNRLASGN